MPVLHVHCIHSTVWCSCFYKNSCTKQRCSQTHTNIDNIPLHWLSFPQWEETPTLPSTVCIPSVGFYWWRCLLCHCLVGKSVTPVSRVILVMQPWHWQLLQPSFNVCYKRNFWVQVFLTALCSPQHCHSTMYLKIPFHHQQWLGALVVRPGYCLLNLLPPWLVNKLLLNQSESIVNMLSLSFARSPRPWC